MYVIDTTVKYSDRTKKIICVYVKVPNKVYHYAFIILGNSRHNRKNIIKL